MLRHAFHLSDPHRKSPLKHFANSQGTVYIVVLNRRMALQQGFEKAFVAEADFLLVRFR